MKPVYPSHREDKFNIDIPCSIMHLQFSRKYGIFEQFQYKV